MLSGMQRNGTSKVWVWVSVAFALLACGGSGLVGCEKPVQAPAGESRRVVVRLSETGPPAVPDPAEEDQGWSDPSYDTLSPSRADGKPTFSNDWFLNNEKVWAEVLAPLKGKPNLRYLEVGVFEGQSFLWMFDNVLTDPSSTATAIDVFFLEGLEARFRENLERAGVSKRARIIKGFSNEALRPLKPSSFDVIYIDGSHTAANVIRDGLLAWDLLEEGGILIFDDYRLRPRFPAAIRPGPVIDAMVTAFYKEADLLHRGWQLILRKRGTDCYDSCSTLGPYYYHWNYKEPNAIGSGTLYDPRTKARVPLTVEERTIIESLLGTRPFGQTYLQPREDFLSRADTRSLIEKLNLL